MVAQNRKGNSLEFALEIDPLRDLCDVLEIPWYTTENSTIYGFYDDNREIFNFEVSIPILTNGKRSIDGIYLFCNNTQDLSLQLRASTKLKRDTLYAQLDIDANRDTITTLLQWDNHNSESLLAR